MNTYLVASIIGILLCITAAAAGDPAFSSDPLLTSDSYTGTIVAAHTCMGDDGAEMFRAIRSYAVGRASKNIGEIAMEHAILKAVGTARRRMNPGASTLSNGANEQISAICTAYTRKLHSADYYSSIDAGSACLRRNINAAMVSVYRH